jgi:hypothetical protein
MAEANNPMRYDVALLKAAEDSCHMYMREHFRAFFSDARYSDDLPVDVVWTNVKTTAEVLETYHGSGLYLILTNYSFDVNPCTLVVDKLKCIYRGHCATVRPRLMSHLFNVHYRASHPGGKAVKYEVCMKLDGNDGIDISAEPYSRYAWRIIIHKMKGSSKTMREQAELAFDDTFRRPLASREG